MKITTVPQLIKELHLGAGVEGYMGLMDRVHIKPAEVMKYATWNNRRYTRNLLERNNDFELLLVGWEAGQQSPIHSYGDEQGWMYVVEGELVVNHYFKSHGEVKMQFYKEVRLLQEKHLYVNDYLGFHSVINSSKGRTLSLHLHARPVDGWTVYDPNTNAFFNLKTSMDSIAEVTK